MIFDVLDYRKFSNHRIEFPQITDFFLKHLRISIIFTTFAAVFKLLKVIYTSVMLL